jgi:ComF family protein
MKNINRFLENLVGFLFPKCCVICRKKNDNFLCFKCFKTINNFRSGTCPNCGKNTQIGEYCPDCKNKFALTGIMIVGDYKNENLKTIIKNYKYQFIKNLAYPLASLLISFLKNNFIPNPVLKNKNKNINLDDYLVTFIPLSQQRERWRGFNQSELLAKIVSQKLGLKLSSDLKKIKNSTAQAKLNKNLRQSNLIGNFKWQGSNLKGQKIIIIDDVYTTGSTLNEAAKELKKHQAQEIWGLVLAK